MPFCHSLHNAVDWRPSRIIINPFQRQIRSRPGQLRSATQTCRFCVHDTGSFQSHEVAKLLGTCALPETDQEYNSLVLKSIISKPLRPRFSATIQKSGHFPQAQLDFREEKVDVSCSRWARRMLTTFETQAESRERQREKYWPFAPSPSTCTPSSARKLRQYVMFSTCKDTNESAVNTFESGVCFFWLRKSGVAPVRVSCHRKRQWFSAEKCESSLIRWATLAATHLFPAPAINQSQTKIRLTRNSCQTLPWGTFVVRLQTLLNTRTTQSPIKGFVTKEQQTSVVSFSTRSFCKSVSQTSNVDFVSETAARHTDTFTIWRSIAKFFLICRSNILHSQVSTAESTILLSW